MLVKERNRMKGKIKNFFNLKFSFALEREIQSHLSIVVNHLVNGFHEKINTTKKKIYSTLVLPYDK